MSKNIDILRKDLNTLYLLKEEIENNEYIIKSSLQYIDETAQNKVNVYEIGQIPKNIYGIILKKIIFYV
ncbi:hypothetical protein CSCA_5098 [Clostridium scatologenes]|uniref:Uncharacterized protein n=1 Tax=Clostridium scatologenes TaxID=1548 RepID=A0A0E3JSB9_CLOSL|nr:hypothetical protein CSCA_5098 [Clostridium scatologenes]